MNHNDQDFQLQELLMAMAQEKKKFPEPEPQNTNNNYIIPEANQSVESKSNQAESQPIKKKKNRCQLCNKKLPLGLRFECRCGFSYCSQHRAHEAHQCTFDYKTYERKNLEKHNQKVVGEKFERI